MSSGTLNSIIFLLYLDIILPNGTDLTTPHFPNTADLTNGIGIVRERCAYLSRLIFEQL